MKSIRFIKWTYHLKVWNISILCDQSISNQNVKLKELKKYLTLKQK